MQEACGELAARRKPALAATAAPRRRPAIVALGLPVISSLTHYDGEEHDDMRVPQARRRRRPLPHGWPLTPARRRRATPPRAGHAPP